MKIKESEFWKGLRKLMGRDDHTEVPEESVNRALEIFQTQTHFGSGSVFNLVPAFLGSVRRGQQSNKVLYELDDRVVQLEIARNGDGFQLMGFAHGFDDITVVLHGKESVFQTELEEGVFEFDELPSGSYTLCFTVEGETHWLRGIQVKDLS